MCQRPAFVSFLHHLELCLRRCCCVCWLRPQKVRRHEQLWSPWWHQGSIVQKILRSVLRVCPFVSPSIINVNIKGHSIVLRDHFSSVFPSVRLEQLFQTLTREPRKIMTRNKEEVIGHHIFAKANNTCSTNCCAALAFHTLYKSHNLHIRGQDFGRRECERGA